MSDRKDPASNWKPFICLSVLVASLFAIVFLKMEVRRLGYEVVAVSRQESKLRDQQRGLYINFLKATRLQRVQLLAQSKLTFRRAEAGQIIQMTREGIALRQ